MKPGALLLVIGALIAPAQSHSEADVYAVVVRLSFHGFEPPQDKESLNVNSMSAAMPTIAGTSPQWRAHFDKFPEALRRAASLPSPTRQKRHNAGSFPSDARMVSDDQAKGLVRWLAVSEVLFTKDGLDALVWVEANCNGACGEYSYIWLHRQSQKDPWSEAGRVQRVVG